MATADVLSLSSSKKPSWTAVPLIVEPLPQTPPSLRDDFNPKKHLAFTPPSKTYSMRELSLPDGHGISPVAVSEPFPLFTEEAIMRMRKEVLSEEVIEHCQWSSNLAHCQLRGYASKYAPFVYDAWKNPEVLKIVSSIAGVELIPALDYDIGHINLSIQTKEHMKQELRDYLEKKDIDDDEGAIVGWHTDSYPFVCVTMLSDCSQMVGGETALRTGTGDVMKVRGPQMGCAVVMQGRYIEHQALRTLGSTERITMVTSFRPKNPLLPDDTVLTTIRPISDLKEIYNQFMEYRLEILEERIRTELKEIREARAAGRVVSTMKFKGFLEEQRKFLEHMDGQMIEDNQVRQGFIEPIVGKGRDRPAGK